MSEGCVVILFLVFLLLLLAAAIWISKAGKHHEWALKIVSLPAIIGGIVVVAILEIPQEFLAGITGIFGTMAGYILRGRE